MTGLASTDKRGFKGADGDNTGHRSDAPVLSLKMRGSSRKDCKERGAWVEEVWGFWGLGGGREGGVVRVGG